MLKKININNKLNIELSKLHYFINIIIIIQKKINSIEE